jgi:hypothetical protein
MSAFSWVLTGGCSKREFRDSALNALERPERRRAAEVPGCSTLVIHLDAGSHVFGCEEMSADELAVGLGQGVLGSWC